MTRLIVIKCKGINDFVGTMNAMSEDDLGFGVDLENNIIFTSEIEIMTKDLENLYEFLSGDTSVCGQWIQYYIDYMPIWDGGGLPRIDVRPEILKKCKEWADYRIDDLLCNIQGSVRPRQIDLENLNGLEIIPDKLKIFINNNSKIFYKTWDSQREYVRQIIDLDLPLFEDSPVMLPYCLEYTILRDALKHLLNFSYPE